MISKKNILIFSPVCIIFLTAITYWIWIDASPRCRRETCNNLDPINLRCDKDAVVISENKFVKYAIQLRYSNRCDASWVRADVPNNSILYLDNKKGSKVGEWNVPDEKTRVPGFQFGNMGSGKNYKACAKFPKNEIICTQ
jgi:Protein of unknown function (DUF2690)